MTTQPKCPACGSDDLRHEADDRHQCRRCLWRCRIAANGKVSDWLKIVGTKRTANRIRMTRPATSLAAD